MKRSKKEYVTRDSIHLTVIVLLVVIGGVMSPSLTTASGTHARAKLTVTSSLPKGTHLSGPVSWIAKVRGLSRGEAINAVQFLIDGKTRWTEHKSPYVFNDDGNKLDPWILGAGSHRFQVKVVTSAKRTAHTPPIVDVVDGQVVPKELQGTYTRTVTAADYARTANLAPAGAIPGVNRPPIGKWTLTWKHNGFIDFADPLHPAGAQTEAFIATPDGKFTLYGPINWLSPPDDRGGFCLHELSPIGIYSWHRSSASQLVISASQTDVECPDRDSVLTGTWTLQPAG